MNRISRLKCIDSLTLKIIAMAFMLCDHMWATIFSNAQILTDIGRLTFPIFAFQMVEAFCHTHSFKKLMIRLAIFALISEIPFNLMYGGSLVYPYHQNVMFTFLIAMIFVYVIDRAKKSGRLWKYLLAIILCGIGGFVIGTVALVDYFGFGVVTVLMFYVVRDLPFRWVLQLAGLYVINAVLMGGLVIPVTLLGMSFEVPQQGLAVLSLIFIWLYNGKLGRHSKAIQYGYYSFYPLHMLVLYLLSVYVIG